MNQEIPLENNVNNPNFQEESQFHLKHQIEAKGKPTQLGQSNSNSTQSTDMNFQFNQQLAMRILERNILRTVYQNSVINLLDKNSNYEIVKNFNLNDLPQMFEERTRPRKIYKRKFVSLGARHQKSNFIFNFLENFNL